MSRVVRATIPEGDLEWEACLRASLNARNSMLRRFGFSPFQIALGHDPHFAGEMLSDQPEVVANSAALSSIPFSRAIEIRLAAHESLLERASDSFDELGYLETEVKSARETLGVSTK